ncbi:MAG TPA: XRE family transcriptional regulator [Clostridia bacterium]|nr:XRE family transcriptional regulator [Clostridia bacterium]
MSDSNQNTNTAQLLEMLQDTSSLQHFLDIHETDLINITLPQYLNLLLEEHHLTKQEVYATSNLDRSLFYQIFNGSRNPSRNALLSIALGMHLSLPETQRLLKIALRGELYPKNRRDAAILFCIFRKLDLIEAELLLDSIGEPCLNRNLG